jgi:hypothetical protein
MAAELKPLRIGGLRSGRVNGAKTTDEAVRRAGMLAEGRRPLREGCEGAPSSSAPLEGASVSAPLLLL